MPKSLQTSLLSLVLLAVAGCSGGGGTTLIALGPNVQTIDAGTTINLTGAVVNDSGHAGATFALVGVGTLGTPVFTNQGSSESIVLPFTGSASGTATITATSVHAPSQIATAVVIVSPALALPSTTLPGGAVGKAYTASVTATGGTGTITYKVSAGALPAGLALNASTGALAGNPTTAGTFAFTITASDMASITGTATQAYTIVVNGQPPVVTAATLATGVVGTAYSQQITYTGGTGTASFVITAGALPATSGLTLSTSGLISGTPTAAAAGQLYSFSIAVTAGGQTSPAVPFTLSVASVPVITTTTLAPGNIGIPYSQQLAASGGVGTPTFAISAGSLPASSGLTLSTSGLLAGTPTAAATYTFSVTATVGTQSSAPQAYTLVVNSLIVTSSAQATGEAGLPFSFRLTAAGGTGSYTWSLATGSAALPAGLTLNGSTGLVTGTIASTMGSPLSGIVVQATDTAGATATQAMTYTINAARGSQNNALLNGSYVFLLSGFDAKGLPQSSVGRFMADGAGNVTGGSLDTNGTGLASPQTSVAVLPGTYAVGADNRGKLTLVTASGTSTFTFALDTVAAGVAGGGSMAEYDLSGQTRAGTFALQSTSLVSPTTLTTGYAFGLQGFAANGTAAALSHRSAAGEFQLAGSTALAGAEVLLSSSSTTAPSVATSGTLTLATTGRGTLALTLPNLGTFNFIVYEASPVRLLLLSADPASGTTSTRDLLSGQALQQTTANGSFTNASLNATSVFHAEKLTGGNPDVQLGLLNIAGSGVASESFDENVGGALTSGTATGTYSVAANGRVALTLGTAGLGGCTDCTSLSGFGYLTGANQGFLIDFSSGALSGFFEPQTATALASGSYSLATPEPLSAAATSTTGTASVTTGTLLEIEDTSTQLTLTPDLALTGTATSAANGRVTTTLTGPGYVVSGTRVLTLDPSAKPVLQVLQHQ